MNAAIAFLVAALIAVGTLDYNSFGAAESRAGQERSVPASAAESAQTVQETGGRRADTTAAPRLTTVRRLKRGPLARHAHRIEAAGWRHGVSPFAIVAISGVESSYGRYPCRSNPRNIWGLGACGRAWTVPYFDTWQEAFDYQARFLRRTWPRARTVYDLHGYCTCSGWGARVASLMRTHYSAGPGVRYPGMKAA